VPDLIGIVLWPLKWAVELILVAWHWVWTSLGFGAADGITWVLSIVGLVIVVRAALIPLFVRQIKSQRKMMEIAPELRKVQEKYKGKRDQLSREAMSRETMALYKKHGTTPVSSCLPLLVQMPIFFSLYSVLSSIGQHVKDGVGGVGVLTPELTQQFFDAKLFGVASLHDTLAGAWEARPEGWEATVAILVVLVILMIASQFFTQLQIISKNLSPEAKTGQAYQMQKIMLYILPLAFIFSGVFFPLGVVIYWFTSNIWTMVQQFIVIREMPTPGSDAAKAREERLARKGKAINSEGKIVSMERYLEEQARLLAEAEKKKAVTPKRQQPVGKQRAKKQARPSTPASSTTPPPAGKSGTPAPSADADTPASSAGSTSLTPPSADPGQGGPTNNTKQDPKKRR
jgi:YidC/Oxa1 family membrane protein insertase